MDELNDAGIDGLVEGIEASTNNDIPMEAAPEATGRPEPQPAPAPQEYEFEASGKKIKAPVDKLLKWASMGYDAPNKIGELSRQLQERDGKLKSLEQYQKTYAPIDEWATKNPDKWKSLFENWQQAQFGANPAQNPEARAHVPPEIIQKLQEYDQRWQKLDEREQTLKTERADQGLTSEIESIRKQFTNLDFDAPDERGNSLEYQILEHATKNGIPSFRAAFRDYCFDKLNQFSETKGLEKGQKALPQKTKAGLLGKDPAPNRATRPVSELIKNNSYDRIHEFILENELGIKSS